jgi:hypothetical protein
VTVYPEPAAADITVDGEPVRPGVTVPVLRSGASDEIEIRVAHPGYHSWSRTLLTSELVSGGRIYVRLDPER